MALGQYGTTARRQYGTTAVWQYGTMAIGLRHLSHKLSGSY